MNKTRLFNSFTPMAMSLAAKFAVRYRKDPHEMRDEASSLLGWIIATWDEHYDADKAMPSTWIHRRLYWGLLDYCSRNSRDCRGSRKMASLEPLLEDEQWDAEARETFMTRLHKDIGQEAKELVHLLLEAPREVVRDLTSSSDKRIRRAMGLIQIQLGWSNEALNKTVWEVRQCLA